MVGHIPPTLSYMPKEYFPTEVAPPKEQTRAQQLKEQTDIVKGHLKEIDYNPIFKLANKARDVNQEIITMLESGEYDFDQRMQLEKLLFDHNKELASFIAPKLKAVDVSGTVDHGITIVLGLQNRPAHLPPAPHSYVDVETAAS